MIPYYQRFMARFPDVQSLAAASQDEVLQHWAGLGYYARGRNLHKCARRVVEDYQGEFPRQVAELELLPGVGRSTAGAIASLAYKLPAAILDGNVKRVLARYHCVDGWPGTSSVAKELWQYAEAYTPSKQNRSYTQAMMDLGAMICTRTKPKCDLCPLSDGCMAFAQGEPENYPGKKPKKALPVKQSHFLLINNPLGELFLQQRPSPGIWGGLWSLPDIEINDEVSAYVETHFGEIANMEAGEKFRHTFSHFHLDIHPIHIVLGKEPKGLKKKVREGLPSGWYAEKEYRHFGMPAPIKKLIHVEA